ncbi:MAG: TIGR02452 family protein [Verrucomicrobiaceae bacterium]
MKLFHALPCVDSPQAAEANQKNLSISRNSAALLGRSALEVIKEGGYELSGTKVSIDNEMKAAINNTISLPPQAILPEAKSREKYLTTIQVRNETTLVAAKMLFERGCNPLALNFANGVHPGGGFLSGALAQEEVLCRSSGLYQTLYTKGAEMYAAHNDYAHKLSSDWAILSPEVPVFRSDSGDFLISPWRLSFVTCAAPYCNDLPYNEKIEAAALLRKRIARVLSIADAYGYTSLVLGAWGCGAFGNSPLTTAKDFRDLLCHEFRGCFKEVVFAITDWSPERRFLGPFRDVFDLEPTKFDHTGALLHILMKVTRPDGNTQEVSLELGDNAKGMGLLEPITGLRFKLTEDGFGLSMDDGYTDGLMLPVSITPAVWDLASDTPVNQVFAEFTRLGREPVWILKRGDWLINNQNWIKCEFIDCRRVLLP